MITNYHTHCNFCDGKDTVEEIIAEARVQSITQIGFSSHAPLPFHSQWAITDESVLQKYCKAVRSYSSQNTELPEILLGLESDFIPGKTTGFSTLKSTYNLDFIIGSVHLVQPPFTDNLWFIDGKQENYDKGIKEYFNNNIRQAVTAYYNQIAEMIVTQKMDIIAHLDKVKLNNAGRFFNENEMWYKNLVSDVIQLIKKHDVIVEINTRGFYQKKRTDFYPSDWIIQLCIQNAIPLMVNSDAHQAKELTFGFEEAHRKLESLGGNSVVCRKNENWEFVDIKKILLH